MGFVLSLLLITQDLISLYGPQHVHPPLSFTFPSSTRRSVGLLLISLKLESFQEPVTPPVWRSSTFLVQK